MKVKELKKQLEGVPDDYEFEVLAGGYYSGDWSLRTVPSAKKLSLLIYNVKIDKPTKRVCDRCGHKVTKSKKHKSGFKHDNYAYDNFSRCRICITEGRFCKYVKKTKVKTDER